MDRKPNTRAIPYVHLQIGYVTCVQYAINAPQTENSQKDTNSLERLVCNMVDIRSNELDATLARTGYERVTK